MRKGRIAAEERDGGDARELGAAADGEAERGGGREQPEGGRIADQVKHAVGGVGRGVERAEARGIEADRGPGADAPEREFSADKKRRAEAGDDDASDRGWHAAEPALVVGELEKECGADRDDESAR
ncbi:MAG TPA: hypothetical protein VG797_11085 [Phycisphaerales bacterium]|nr:hypothetical protein [Phycisphaerales bacterium]